MDSVDETDADEVTPSNEERKETVGTSSDSREVAAASQPAQAATSSQQVALAQNTGNFIKCVRGSVYGTKCL